MKAPQKKNSGKTAAPKVAAASTPISPAEAPALPWWKALTMESVVRGILLFFAATLPLYYDLGVPEVSGDIRWFATEFFAGLCALLLVGNAFVRGRGTLSLRWPPLMWIALGLTFWAAISLIDALNWTRGIVLIKAMYAQLILMVIVYLVATPRFVRQLLWALVLPLLFTSVLGMWQFQAMTDQALHMIMDNSVFIVFKPLVWVLDGIAGIIAEALGWGGRQVGIVGLSTGYFLQSAVPGSTFANKNLAGSWTAMMLPIAMYLLLTAKRWPAQAFASVLLGLGSVFLVYSRARASWVALFAAMMVLAALIVIVPAWRKAVWRHLDLSHAWWLLVPVMMLARWQGDVSPVQGSYAVDRSPSQQVAALVNSSWNEIGGRLAYNLNSTQIVKDYWFNGVGLGGFYTIYPPYYNAVVMTPFNSYNVMARPQRTHTDMMQAFDEMGILGGILYVSLFVGGIAMALRLGGRRAGALGGYLTGAGMLTMILALTVFLEYQRMLSIPEPWNWVFYLVMGGAIAGMLGRALVLARHVQDETEAADDVQLMGLMAGIALLTISINALFDFPMQLPTAPAAAAMILGVVCSIYVRRAVEVHAAKNALVGPKVTLRTGYAGALVLFVVLAVAWVAALRDGLAFREGNVFLKAAMVRIFSGINDETTLALLDKAYEVYPYDQRIEEHIGVAYANYNGQAPLPVEARIAKLEWVMKGDPWGANHLVNLAGLYLQRGEAAMQAGNAPLALDSMARAEEVFGKLQKVAAFSHFTWGIGGMLRMMQGKNEDAIWMFRRALSIEPNYAPAITGLQMAVSRSLVKPLTIQDGMTQVPR